MMQNKLLALDRIAKEIREQASELQRSRQFFGSLLSEICQPQGG
jgi:hypothetical protein